MMGRFLYWMNVSLDLRIEQVPGDAGAGEWLRIDEELHREFNARAKLDLLEQRSFNQGVTMHRYAFREVNEREVNEREVNEAVPC
jgi:hypothetical protein